LDLQKSGFFWWMDGWIAGKAILIVALWLN
jgi:hypothetical protein